MVGHGAKFGRKKEEAIAALLVQRNVEEAARSIGVATQTLVRWMKVPEFQIAYREARRAAFSQATARLQQAMSAAVTTLLKLAVDPNAPAAVKARAAYYILTLATKAMETDDIDARVLALERAAELTNQGSMNLTPHRKVNGESASKTPGAREATR
jgi:transposase-like protein